jgi:hypothetical protein
MKDHSHAPRHLLWLLVPAVLASIGHAEILHVNSRTGDDGHPGTPKEPLRTIERAAALVNDKSQSGPATIVIAPGCYSLNRCVVFEGGRVFTERDRLTIRASILPDDPRWMPEHMPTVLSIENPKLTAGSSMPRETYSLKIQTSHVTVQGLRFLGNPSFRNWHCCIERIGKNLDDLLVTQCMFMGNRDTANIYCATLATGDRFVVDHCIFSGCHACTVFWDGLDGIAGKGCAMRYCIIDGAHQAGVWTCQTADNFQFHHNVIASSEYIWMRKSGDRQKYRLSDCALVGNKYFSGYGAASGPAGQTGAEVSFDKGNITTDGRLVFASDAKTHLAEESAGHNLRAGLFHNH